MRYFLRIGLSALLSTLVLLAAAAGARAADTTLRLSIVSPDDPFRSNTGAMATVFKSLVETASNGRIEVQLFPNGQLGRDNESIDQVLSGFVESTMASAGSVAQHYPLVAVFDMPFSFPNIAVASKVIDKDSSFGRKFVSDMDDKTGWKTLAMIDSGGFFNFSNSKRPITHLEDMNGLRIRTMTLPSHQAIISSLGGQPVPLSSAELYTAMQTGTVDGAMNPVPTMVFERYAEVQGYLSISNHVITPTIWIINKSFYDGLSSEDRAIVDWASDAAADAGRGINRIIEASENGLPKLGERMEINTIPPAEIEKFAAIAQPAIKQLIADNYGEAGLDMLQALQDDIEAQK